MPDDKIKSIVSQLKGETTNNNTNKSSVNWKDYLPKEEKPTSTNTSSEQQQQTVSQSDKLSNTLVQAAPETVKPDTFYDKELNPDLQPKSNKESEFGGLIPDKIDLKAAEERQVNDKMFSSDFTNPFNEKPAYNKELDKPLSYNDRTKIDIKDIDAQISKLEKEDLEEQKNKDKGFLDIIAQSQDIGGAIKGKNHDKINDLRNAKDLLIKAQYFADYFKNRPSDKAEQKRLEALYNEQFDKMKGAGDQLGLAKLSSSLYGQLSSGNIGQAWYDLRKGFTSPLAKDFFTLGLNELKRNYDVLGIAKRSNADPNSITPEEQKVLSAYNELNMLQNSNELPFSYQVGQGVVEMIPYMAQFAATSGVGTAAEGAVTKYLTKKLGTELIKNSFLKGAANTGVKLSGRLAGAVVQNSLLPQSPNSFAQRELKNYKIETNDSGLVAAKMIADPTSSLSNFIKAGVEGVVSTAIEKGSLTESIARKMATKEGKSKLLGYVNKLAKATNWNGTGYEFMEEVETAALTNLFNGDQTWSEVFDPKTMGVTFMTIMVTGGAFKAANLIEKGVTSFQLSQTMNKNKSDIIGRGAFGKGIVTAMQFPSVGERLNALSKLDWDNQDKETAVSAMTYIRNKTQYDVFKGFERENKVQQNYANVQQQVDFYSNPQSNNVEMFEDEKGVLYYVKNVKEDGTAIVFNTETNQIEQKKLDNRYNIESYSQGEFANIILTQLNQELEAENQMTDEAENMNIANEVVNTTDTESESNNQTSYTIGQKVTLPDGEDAVISNPMNVNGMVEVQRIGADRTETFKPEEINNPTNDLQNRETTVPEKGQEVQKVQVQNTPEIPKTKDGNVDFNSITDPSTFATALNDEFASDSQEVLDGYIEDATNDLAELGKIKDRAERKRTEKKLKEKLAIYEQVNSIINPQIPTNNGQKQAEGQGNEVLSSTIPDTEVNNVGVDVNTEAPTLSTPVDENEQPNKQEELTKAELEAVNQRQNPITTKVTGVETNREFATNIPIKGNLTVIDVSELQPSHVYSERNKKHGIPDAQPKERNDKASDIESTKIANNPNWDKLANQTLDVYHGAPTVNSRGEVIQGNNRSEALRKYWEFYPDDKKGLKQYLIDNAVEFGLNTEDINNIENPVLVNMVDVSDEEAIKLGQYTAQDLETGGKRRITPKETLRKLNVNDVSRFVEIITNGNTDDETIREAIRRNAYDAIKYLSIKKAITDTQFQSAFNQNTNQVTKEAIDDLTELLKYNLFIGAEANFDQYFERIPYRVQNALIKTSHVNSNDKSNSLTPFIQEAIKLYNIYMAASKNGDAMTLDQWRNSVDIFSGKKPDDDFSELSFVLSKMFISAKTEKEIVEKIKKYYQLVNGITEGMFPEPPISMKQALNILFNFVEKSEKNVERPINTGNASPDDKRAIEGEHKTGEERGGLPISGSNADAAKGEGSNNRGRNAGIANEKEVNKNPDNQLDVEKEGEKETPKKDNNIVIPEKTNNLRDNVINYFGEENIDFTKTTISFKKVELKNGDVYYFVNQTKWENNEEPPKYEKQPKEVFAGDVLNEVTKEQQGKNNVKISEYELNKNNYDKSKPLNVTQLIKGEKYLTQHGSVMVFERLTNKKESKDNLFFVDPNGVISVSEEFYPLIKQPQKEEPKTEPKYGDKQARYDELKAKLKGKLNNLNAGIDPELFAIGVEMAAIKIEMGVKKFSQFAKEMVEELGDAIKPYLKAIYNGVRDLPEMEKIEPLMDDYSYVKKADIEKEIEKEIHIENKSSNFDNNLNKQNDVYNRPGSSQRNSEDSPDEIPEVKGIISDDGGTSGQGGNKPTSNKGGIKPIRTKTGSGLFTFDFGEFSDNEVHKENEGISSENDVAGDTDGRGGNFDDRTGQDVDNTGEQESEIGSDRIDTSFKERTDRKIKEQLNAENIPVKIGDEENIRATLPLLLPEQQDDVLKAETRFFDEKHQTKELAYGKGMLFTNGTGTGKTFTGLGIVKRFEKQGKKNILIVVPTEAKIKDWIKDAEKINLTVTQIQNTKDKGQGINVTTYATFRENQALKERDFDLVVYDESHRLMEDKNGKYSSTTFAHQRISNISEHQALERLKDVNPVWIKYRELMNEYRDSKTIQQRKDEISKLLEPIDAEMKNQLPQMEERAKKAYENTKVVFLSATPFKAHFNLRYANGVLFDWGNETTYQGYSRVDAESRYFLDNFGSAYEWKYHRLQTKQKANAEAIAMQEIDYSNKLMQQGVLSGRSIESDKDYSREFPLVALENSELLNKAFNDIFDHVGNEFEALRDSARNVFYNYNYTTKLFEALKTSLVIPRIDQHLEKGRKVVVFHRRKQAGVTPPFDTVIRVTENAAEAILNDENSSGEQKEKAVEMKKQADLFKNKYADLLEYEKTLVYDSAIDQLLNKYGNKIVTINGETPKKDKVNNIVKFNDDNSGVDIILVQEEAGKEGISLHDVTGNHQRVLINLSMPISSTTALQIEGRIFRIGQETNAIFEYPLIGLDMEIENFGRNINRKLSTTENIALGNQARDLLRSFAEGVLFNSSSEAPNDNQGIGGKEYDKKTQGSISEFQKAILVYSSNQKQRGKRDSREGIDYYPTPEPLGQKMVEWADLRTGDTALEPSAGHGAIAMWFPDSVNAISIEPSFSLYSKLNARSGGGDRKILNQLFEEFNIINKVNAVVMNPPFGKGGSLAIAHVEKAFKHLREGGRVVALIPRGNADKLLDKFLYGVDENGKLINPDAQLIATINLPSSTFEQAGTAVNARVVVIDKINYKSLSDFKAEVRAEDTERLISNRGALLRTAEQINEEALKRYNAQNVENTYTTEYDLSDYKDINDFFNSVEFLNVENRNIVEGNKIPTTTNNIPENIKPNTDGVVSYKEGKHSRTGEILHLGVINEKVERDEYDKINKTAKYFKGYYSSFAKGFIFPNKESADAFINEINKPDVNFRRVSPIGFYSTVEDALGNIKQEKGTVAQFKAMLLKNGAKQAELDWMGWDEHFADTNKKVTKADIQDFIDSNNIDVKEVVKGDYSNRNLEAVKVKPFIYNVVDIKTNEIVLHNVSQSRADEFIDNAHDGTNTKFSQYQEPGGENYKELLLTMPKKSNIPEGNWIAYLDKGLNKKREYLKGFYSAYEARKWVEDNEDKYEYTLDYESKKAVYEIEERDSNFHSSHFDEPNILAHIRFNEREVNGEKVLFVEEIQSDWSQSLKKEMEKFKDMLENDFENTFKRLEKAGLVERIC